MFRLGSCDCVWSLSSPIRTFLVLRWWVRMSKMVGSVCFRFFFWFNFSLSVVVSIMKVVCCVLLWGKEVLADTHIIEFWCWNFRNIRESFYLGEGNLIFCCTGPNDHNFWQIKIVIILISHINISFLLFIFLLIWSFSFRLQ